MHHRKSGRKFGRTSSHRRAMFRNMSCSLIEHQLIKTTLPKAKELRRVIEPLITLAKEDSVANRRLANSRLCNKAAVKTLFETIGPRFADRPGGYLRVIKCGLRSGDSAPMAYIQLIDEPCKPKAKAKKAKVEKKAPKAEATTEEVVEASTEAETVEAPTEEAKKADDKADKKDA